MENDRIQDLIDRPSESLPIEYKGWIDPDSIEGIAKIVRAAIAIRNHGGGYIVFGLKDGTGEPDIENAPIDNGTIRKIFHIDNIQGMITKYSSEPFEVRLHYRQAKGSDYPIFPVIEIPSGIMTPIAAKANLIKGGNKYLIKENSIYVRTLLANNTPSTSEAIWKDYAKLVEVCFDNREADIGRFLRRHLGALSPELILQIRAGMTEALKPDETIEEKIRSYLTESEERFDKVVVERAISLPRHGYWEVALKIVGDLPPYNLDKEFLNLLKSNNPNHTGWPIWLDSRNFYDTSSFPYVFNDAWEALIVFLDTGSFNTIDFMRLHPEGKFYQRSAFKDDISLNKLRPEPMTCLGFGFPVNDTAEAILVGLAFARAMGFKTENTQLAFGFKWSKLKNRMLNSWAWPGRYISPYSRAYQDEVFSFINVPLETSESAIVEYVNNATKPLFKIFDGFILGINVVEDLVNRLIERRF
jgi:hypothetical protein